jgi:hypothetical protein
MSVIGSNLIAGASGQGGGYNLTNSLRFRSSASAYLSRTNSNSPTNAKIGTLSMWVKRGSLATGNSQYLFETGTGTSNNNHFQLFFQTDNALSAGQYSETPFTNTAVFRDPSAWYHIVITYDSTQATASNRFKLYINNQLFTSSTTISQNNEWAILQAGQLLNFGRHTSVARHFDGYLNEINLIDGQALTPSSFGETSTTTGVWIPKKYAGTYGTNGFYLPFTDNSALTTSSNVGLGRDYSGNGNYWTTNNISITAGATYDSMTDVPTLTSTTAANYAVISPINGVGTALSITGANLNFAQGSSLYGLNVCSMSIKDKTYFEITLGASSTGSGKNSYCGVGSNGSANQYTSAGYFGTDSFAWSLGYSNATAYISNNDTQNTQSGTIANGDVFMYAVDPANGRIWFGRNGTWYAGSPSAGTGASYTNLPTEVFPVVQAYDSSTHSINFGQRPFAYTPPTGFVALNTFNLPTPTIGATASTTANKNMDVTTYTGNGTSQSIVNSGSMQPDFIWFKNRGASEAHRLADSVRGAGKVLYSNLTNAEATESTGLLSFNSNGFSLGAGVPNGSGSTNVAWQWKANGAAVTNTAGSISSQVSANTSAGFSVVTYTGTGANATVGHGLGIAPSMIIVRNRDIVQNWIVGHTSLWATNANYQLILNSTNAVGSNTAIWNGTVPTSSVFSIGTDSSMSGNTNKIVAYCFSEVAGYSKFGSYTGNGSADGTFVFTGFRPRFVMVKATVTAGGSWVIQDTSRNIYNAAPNRLFPNTSDAEGTSSAGDIDILSNGFKLRNTSGSWNTNGETYIYMAFAENPFKYANAR